MKPNNSALASLSQVFDIMESHQRSKSADCGFAPDHLVQMNRIETQVRALPIWQSRMTKSEIYVDMKGQMKVGSLT